MKALAALLCTALAAGAPLAPQARRSHVKRLEASPLQPGLRGRRLARVPLAASLDALNRAETIELEGRRWELGLAADERFERFFAVFSRNGKSRLDPVVEPKTVLRAGLLLPLDSASAYRFRVRLRRRAPVRDSKLIAETLAGTPVASWTTGELIDGLLKKGVELSTSNGDVWLAYLTDRDAETGEPRATRSLLFFEPRRFIPKAWRLPAAELSDRGVVVLLGRTRLSLKRGGGELLVEELPPLQ